MLYRRVALLALTLLLPLLALRAQVVGVASATPAGSSVVPLGEPVGSDSLGINSIAPNPCKLSTTIRFALPAEGNATLVLNDPFGREVLKLAEGTMSPGEHTVRLKTDDLAEGAYVCVLRSSAVVAVWPLVVMR